ncbi:unnamed protein product [Larinioides sclopetarius]|uniref:Bestrophin homolog n=1 Tax=Larinioides sclopetarius TaxID=280406 RepID=A0AAV2BEJ7_9ARAC
MIASYVHGTDERSRMIRRTLARYLILIQVLTYQAVSTAVKRRFPTTQHLVSAGIMTKEEKSVLDKISFTHGKWWISCHWFCSLATRARKEGRIKDPVLLNGMLNVAEQILHPYGEDDDDFELNWCLDRSVQIAYLVVDNLQLKHPKVTKDFFWDETEPILPRRGSRPSSLYSLC